LLPPFEIIVSTALCTSSSYPSLVTFIPVSTLPCALTVPELIPDFIHELDSEDQDVIFQLAEFYFRAAEYEKGMGIDFQLNVRDVAEVAEKDYVTYHKSIKDVIGNIMKASSCEEFAILLDCTPQILHMMCSSKQFPEENKARG